MLVLVRIRFQGAGQRVRHSWAGAGFFAALEPGVVVDADPGERRDLLPAASPGYGAPRLRG
jgi:hypothetical protein